MKLRLSDWAHVAEILSGLAVVVTLVILILGVEENTEVTRASMYAAGIESLNQLSHTVAADPDLSRMWNAYHNGQTSDLTEEEKERLLTIIVSMFRTFDTVYSMARYDLLGDNERVRFERQICVNTQNAELAGYTEILRQLTSDDFSTFTDTMCPE